MLKKCNIVEQRIIKSVNIALLLFKFVHKTKYKNERKFKQNFKLIRKQMEKVLKTPHAIKKDAKDLKVYYDYMRLSGVEGSNKTAVIEHIANKYDVCKVTVYAILKRVQKGLNEQR